MSTVKFDGYAHSYDALHQHSVSASGEPPEYFAEYKLECMKRLGAPAKAPLLDYGCGIGNVTTVLARHFAEIHGYDPSKESIQVVRGRLPGATFHSELGEVPSSYFGSAVLSGVLHHVPRPDRVGLLEGMREKLAPGGKLYVFEHNPLNPVTRHAVRECAFDDDADLLSPWLTKRLLERAGFSRVTLDFIVFFPRLLATLRPLERHLAWLPLGAQVLVVGERAGA